MQLLYISGFPRSGTSYLHEWLISCLNCVGVFEEQGLDVVWKTMHLLDNTKFDQVSSSLWKLFSKDNSLSEKELLQIKETHWMGIFVWKNMKALGPSFLDGWCWSALKKRSLLKRLALKYYVVKTPTFSLSPDWPEKYVEQSDLFSDYKVIVLARDPEEVYCSGHKKFPFWKDDGVTEEKLYNLWMRMYNTVKTKSDKWIIVNHRDLMNNTEQTLACLCKRLGIFPGPKRKFRVGTTDWRRWLTEIQKDQVENILQSPKVLKVNQVSNNILRTSISKARNKLWLRQRDNNRK